MRRPKWLRKKRNITNAVLSTRAKIRLRGLHTVCESARCPNMAECYGRGAATVMILGDTCTRNCRFCNVESGGVLESPGKREGRDIAQEGRDIAQEGRDITQEGRAIAEFACDNGLSYLVITSVTRDDLHDGGASHFKRVVSDVKSLSPELKIEVLVPDFNGCASAVEQILLLPIEVFGHNMETVKPLYPEIRPGADYSQSLEVLATARRIAASERIDGRILIKSGIMVGLGETGDELAELFSDLARVGIDILTIGQYLQPSNEHLPVARYYEPDEFVALERLAVGRGIDVVKAGPYVRSSYLAEESFKLAEGSFHRSLHPERGI